MAKKNAVKLVSPTPDLIAARVEHLSEHVKNQYASAVREIDAVIAAFEKLKAEITSGGPSGYPGPHPVTISVAQDKAARVLADVRGTFEREMAIQYLRHSEPQN